MTWRDMTWEHTLRLDSSPSLPTSKLHALLLADARRKRNCRIACSALQAALFLPAVAAASRSFKMATLEVTTPELVIGVNNLSNISPPCPEAASHAPNWPKDELSKECSDTGNGAEMCMLWARTIAAQARASCLIFVLIISGIVLLAGKWFSMRFIGVLCGLCWCRDKSSVWLFRLKFKNHICWVDFLVILHLGSRNVPKLIMFQDLPPVNWPLKHKGGTCQNTICQCTEIRHVSIVRQQCMACNCQILIHVTHRKVLPDLPQVLLRALQEFECERNITRLKSFSVAVLRDLGPASVASKALPRVLAAVLDQGTCTGFQNSCHLCDLHLKGPQLARCWVTPSSFNAVRCFGPAAFDVLQDALWGKLQIDPAS